MGSHFTDQCSNLDLRFGNGRHRMDEYQRYPQPTKPLVCQPASLATIVHVTYLMMAVICEKDTIVSIPLASTVLLFSAGLWFGWRQRNLFYLSAIPFAILMILLSLFICHSNLRDVNIFLLSGIIVITGTTLLIYAILHLKKQWYGTEE